MEGRDAATLVDGERECLELTKSETYIHPSALVETDEIGTGTRVWAYSHLMQGAVVGQDCNIGEHCFIETGAQVGNRVTIKNGNMLWEGVVIEDGAFIGPNVFFTNDRYPRSPRLEQAARRYRDRNWLVTTVVKQGASLGAGAVIVPGVTIGEYAMVGAGSIVTRDVPPYALVIGNPARGRGWMCQCGQPLGFSGDDARCVECGRSYMKQGNAIQLLGESVAEGAIVYAPHLKIADDGGTSR